MTLLSFYLPLFFLLPFLANAGYNKSVAGMNIIDRCWRRSPNWAANRQRLAMCSIGFAGKMRSNRGRRLTHYTVTDSSDHATDPKPGTLRYGASVMRGKVWITFQQDMQIALEKPLFVNNYTTIDGRGADVQIAYGDGIIIYNATNVIIHGIQIHHIRPTSSGEVVIPGNKTINLDHVSDGDAIWIYHSKKVWIDHNTLYRATDGLLDITHGSTRVTVSNNWFREHDKVMLLGHVDHYGPDSIMRVTIVYNRFGPNCNQRMPRIRHGYAHVVNNYYDGWGIYAIGGSSDPTVTSQANLYIAPESSQKSVIWQMPGAGRGTSWRLKSVDDAFENGAYFHQIGIGSRAGPHYGRLQKFPVESPNAVRSLTKDAGALQCSSSSVC